MSDFIEEFFTTTTADDQNNYFTGEYQVIIPRVKQQVPAGEYRVIDGDFFRVLSGGSTEDVRKKIKARLTG
ncbi:MAG: hypothetical protein AB1724_09995 [Thermodesulfobacteriota bacterium]